MKKKVPRLKTDRQAEPFLAQDLSGLDFSQFKPAGFEFEKKDEQINMRVPKPLLAAVKARARARGIPYTRFIRGNAGTRHRPEVAPAGFRERAFRKKVRGCGSSARLKGVRSIIARNVGCEVLLPRLAPDNSGCHFS
jgi:predicted DNA binding CopG/RHH family protein